MGRPPGKLIGAVDALFSSSAPKPPAAELAVYGLTPEDFPELDDEFGVWPDNAMALNTFAAMQTQWRVGMTGATGFDYAALPAVLSMLGVPEKAHPDTFECLRWMELHALDLMRKKQA